MSQGPNTPPPPEPRPPEGGQPPPPGQGAPPPAPQDGHAPQGQPGGVGQPADLMTRVLARLIDSLLLWVVSVFIVGFVIVGALFSGAGAGGFGGFNVPGLVSSIISAALFIGYFAYLESNKGQTLGKMAMKVEVRGPDGSHPTMEQAIKRNAWMALSIVPVIGGLLQLGAAIYIMVTINSNTPSRQGWHDQFAGGTSVIKIG